MALKLSDDAPRPYLIQRLNRKETEGSLKDKKVSDVWGCDYMSSAEFEFGAIPNCIRAMNASVLQPFTLTIDGKKVFGLFDAESYKDIAMVEHVLNCIAAGVTRHKEAPHFPKRKYATWETTTTGWLDIRNNLFWSYENMNNAMIQMLQNSVQFMDGRLKNAGK